MGTAQGHGGARECGWPIARNPRILPALLGWLLSPPPHPDGWGQHPDTEEGAGRQVGGDLLLLCPHLVAGGLHQGGGGRPDGLDAPPLPARLQAPLCRHWRSAGEAGTEKHLLAMSRAVWTRSATGNILTTVHLNSWHSLSHYNQLHPIAGSWPSA